MVIGPPIDERTLDKVEQLDKVERHVQDAIAKGARLVAGGERFTSGAFARGVS